MFEQCRCLLVPQTCMHCACTYLYSRKHVHATYGHIAPPSHPITHFHCFLCLSRTLAQHRQVHDIECGNRAESLPMLLHPQPEHAASLYTLKWLQPGVSGRERDDVSAQLIGMKCKRKKITVTATSLRNKPLFFNC